MLAEGAKTLRQDCVQCALESAKAGVMEQESEEEQEKRRKRWEEGKDEEGLLGLSKVCAKT